MPHPTRLALLQSCRAALESFQTSKSKFRIIASISAPQSSFHEQSSRTSHPSETSTNIPTQSRTLFILDSSYNPPSRAHASLATSAVYAVSSSNDSNSNYPSPARLLLLFSTANADKAAQPAAFEHRLATIVLFAEDLSAQWASTQPQSQKTEPPTHPNEQEATSAPFTPIDIGLTTEPIYHDKSSAIAASALSSHDEQEAHFTPPNEHRPVSPSIYSGTRHIHLVGYDTIIRIFNPKYYKDHDPPLSALDEYFKSHGFRATVRPTSSGDQQVQEQLQWVDEQLSSGKLEAQGGRPEWANSVEMVEATEDIGNVSSTKVREAVKSGDWAGVEQACSPQVAAWIKEFGLYTNDET